MDGEHSRPLRVEVSENVAWRMRGGDLIYVAESYPSRIVAVGRVKGELNARAYRFVADTKIVDDDERPWRHGAIPKNSDPVLSNAATFERSRP
jgi:hypothetical protein